MGFGFILALCCGAASTPTSTPEAIVARVVATYQQGGDMTASFTQTYQDQWRKKTREERGQMWVKKDGRVRWTYMHPERKDFVFDGKTAFFYEPESGQVTVFEQFRDSPVAHAMEFLWGQGDLPAMFAFAACDATCGSVSESEVAVRLNPREPMASVDHVVLVVDPRAQRVRRSRVMDALGNSSEYVFSDVRFGVPISGTKFDFTMPEGVSVLRANPGGPDTRKAP